MKKLIIKLVKYYVKIKDKFKKEKVNSTLKSSIIVKNNAANNKAIIVYPDGRTEDIKYIEGLEIVFWGNNNSVKLYAPLANFVNCKIEMTENAEFILHESEYFVKNLTVWRMKNGTKLEIGKNFSCEEVKIALHGEENIQVSIGNDCMFSFGIFLQTTDNHSIIDKNTGMPLNFGGNIKIGNHVWLCPEVRVHKNVIIPDDCVIGTRSIITKSIEESNCVAIGIPARIIKHNITWNKTSASDFVKNKINPT